MQLVLDLRRDQIAAIAIDRPVGCAGAADLMPTKRHAVARAVLGQGNPAFLGGERAMPRGIARELAQDHAHG